MLPANPSAPFPKDTGTEPVSRNPSFILVLDEPTDGLDPNQKLEVRKLIKNLGKEKAILFSTHILEEVSAACTRAVIVDQGVIVADGTPEQLTKEGGGSLYDLFHKVTTFETPAA
jgi:ABC-2 type transport system ATP-binding protein